MEGEEKKSGLKKRSKPVGIGLNSDDDEPIGSLLKVKKMRNPKKVKVGLEFEGQKGTKAKVMGGKMAVQSVDLGGMDDTLASFRKKLKGPKKDGGSGTVRIRGCALSTVESCKGPLEDETLDVEVPSKTGENGHKTGGNRSDATMDEGCGIKSKVRRSKTDYPKKAVDSRAATDSGLESLGFKYSPPKDQNVAGTSLGEGSSHSMDENLEDSLSAYILKAQSGSIKKTRASPNLRQKSGNQKTEDDLNPTCECASESLQNVAIRRPLYASLNQCSEVPAPNGAPLESQSEGTHENPMVDLSAPNFKEGHGVCTCGSKKKKVPTATLR